jgi:APA family basic amino acid/polyamine antiporter
VSRSRFGALDGAALVVTTVVGAGIFTVPTYVASLAGSAPLIMFLWVLGGAIAMMGALCYAELAARHPRGGAEYVYIREAFGATAGFLSGWTSFVAGFSGAIAAAAVGFGAYLARVAPIFEGSQTLVAVALIGIFTVVSLAGVRSSTWAANALALLVIAGVVTLALAGLAGAAPGIGAVGGASMGAASALVPIFFTYSGWNAAAYVAGEFGNPQRDVPRALISGTLLVTVLYVGLNAALVRTLSVGGVSVSQAPVAEAALATFGASGSVIVGVLVLVALASSVCAMIITGPRIYLEMARDGVLPPALGRRTARGVPRTAVVAQSVWCVVLVLSGTFEQIVAYTGFAIVVFSGLAVAALFVMRRRDGPPSTYRVPGYPVVPALFLVLVAIMAAAAFRFAPGPSVAGVALIGAGLLARAALMPGRPAAVPLEPH